MDLLVENSSQDLLKINFIKLYVYKTFTITEKEMTNTTNNTTKKNLLNYMERNKMSSFLDFPP